MSKGMWVLIGGIIVVVVVAGAAVFRRPAPPSPAAPLVSEFSTSSSAAEAGGSAPQAGWTSHTNTEYGYSIAYPSDWKCGGLFNPTSSEETILNIPIVEPAGVSSGENPCGGQGYGDEVDITVLPLSAAGVPPQSSSETDPLAAFLRTVDKNSTRFYNDRFRSNPFVVIAAQHLLINGLPAVEQAELLDSKVRPDGYAAIAFSTYVTNGAYVYRLSTTDYTSPGDALSSYLWISRPLYEKQLTASGTAEDKFPSNVISTFHVFPAGGGPSQ